MSAIAGILRLDGAPVEEAVLRTMASAMPGRCPDGVGIVVRDEVGLVQGLFRTGTTAVEEALPATRGQFSVVADARIDNRGEILAALGVSGPEGDSLTEAELVLRCYEAWGADCVARIVGDFAFAVWDGRRRELFCARDPLGARPLYYARTPRAFVFGSSAKAVLRGPDVPSEINEVRIADFLLSARYGSLECVDRETTFYAQVLRLLEGHALAVSATRWSMRRTFWLEPRETLRLGSTAEYAEALLATFSEAVRCRMRGTCVASTLSGGLDSSSVVGVARKQRLEAGGSPLLTVSAFADSQPWARAAECVRAVAGLPGIDARFVRAEEMAGLTGEMERVLGDTDDPFDYHLMKLIHPVSRAAAAAGARVLLDGVDGDLAVSHSTEWMVSAFATGDWRRGWQLSRGLARCYETNRIRLALSWGLRPAANRVATRVLPGGKHLQNARRRRYARRVGRGELVRLRPEFADRIGLQDRLRWAWHLNSGDEGPDATPLAEYRRLTRWLPLSAAFERRDRIAAATGVESRHPFGDRRLIELCATLPPETLMLEGWPKGLLREAMAGLLPDHVRWSPWLADPHWALFRTLCQLERAQWTSAIREAQGMLTTYIDMRDFWDRQRRMQPGNDRDAALALVAALAFWLRRSSN
jgi:asparagine synthase (glutamine-hydrolysing)